LLSVNVNDHRPKPQTARRLSSPIVQLEIAFRISIATKIAVIANPKICVVWRFASSSFLNNCGSAFASIVNRFLNRLYERYDGESCQNQCTLSRRAYPKVSAAKAASALQRGSSLGVQSRAVARSFGTAEGDGIAAIPPLARMRRRSGLLQARKFHNVSLDYATTVWRIRLCDSDSTRVHFIVPFILRRGFFFSSAVRGVWDLPSSGIWRDNRLIKDRTRVVNHALYCRLVGQPDQQGRNGGKGHDYVEKVREKRNSHSGNSPAKLQA
jgi:hypothetical protein